VIQRKKSENDTNPPIVPLEKSDSSKLAELSVAFSIEDDEKDMDMKME